VVQCPTIVVNSHRSRDVVELAKKQDRFVLIDRTTIWGNPYSHRRDTAAKFIVDTREEAIRQYEEWLLAQPHLVEQLPALRGRVLGCHCLPLACHGLVLARLAERCA